MVVGGGVRFAGSGSDGASMEDMPLVAMVGHGFMMPFSRAAWQLRGAYRET